MILIDSFEEVKFNLKHGEILTMNGKDSFYYKDDFVTRKFNGNAFKIPFETFVELYKSNNFYLPEEEAGIDEEKDSEYYGKIQKSN